MLDFTKDVYDKIHSIVFQPGYPGYTPNIIEAPNGDSNWDAQKRYAHISKKYLEQMEPSIDRAYLLSILSGAMILAHNVAWKLRIPEEFCPGPDTTIRILEYPPGAVAHPHTDFDLFTLMLYRDDPEAFRYLDGEPAMWVQRISRQIHFGELLPKIKPGDCAYPTKHEVVASCLPQHSAVLFVMPSLDAVLPNGQPVHDWLEERKARSRKEIPQ